MAIHGNGGEISAKVYLLAVYFLNPLMPGVRRLGQHVPVVDVADDLKLHPGVDPGEDADPRLDQQVGAALDEPDPPTEKAPGVKDDADVPRAVPDDVPAKDFQAVPVKEAGEMVDGPRVNLVPLEKLVRVHRHGEAGYRVVNEEAVPVHKVAVVLPPPPELLRLHHAPSKLPASHALMASRIFLA